MSSYKKNTEENEETNLIPENRMNIEEMKQIAEDPIKQSE